MHKSDYLSLDGHLLRLFVLIHETGSVSRTAEQLGINQSSASHGLERLRKLMGDPLFIRSGRGIVPTARAIACIEQARSLLLQMEQIAASASYDPAQETGAFTIAANDYEVETTLKPLLSLIREKAPNARLQIVRAYSQKEWVPFLRHNEADLVLAPALESSESDLAQQTLFEDDYRCIYDPNSRKGPTTLDAFCEAPHAIMVTGRDHRTRIDHQLETLERTRKIVVVSPSFSALSSMMRGTDIIATLPTRLLDTLFSDFKGTSPPLPQPSLAIAQIWHARNSSSPRHQWLRDCLRSAVQH